MSTGLYKGMVLGLVAGLIIGVTGGYYGKNLDAQAPITGDTAVAVGNLGNVVNFVSLEGDESGLYGDVIMTGIGEGLIKYLEDKGNGDAAAGVKAVIGSSTSGSFNLDKTAAAGILIFAATKAFAEKDRQCSSIELNWAKDAIKQAYENRFFFFQTDYCTESIKLDGTLEVKIYDSGIGYSHYLEFTFRGIQTKTYWQRSIDGCFKVVESREVVKKGVIEIADVIWFVSDAPKDAKFICSGSIEIDIFVKNPKFDKDKCCGPGGDKEEIL